MIESISVEKILENTELGQLRTEQQTRRQNELIYFLPQLIYEYLSFTISPN